MKTVLFKVIAGIGMLMLNVACAQMENTKGPPFSQLAGSWSAKLGEMIQALSEKEDNIADLAPIRDDRLVLVTINYDGTFDWSMTSEGITEGWSGLRRKADQCVRRTDPTQRFEVTSSEYAPTSSRIEVRRLNPGSYPWSTMSLDARLTPNGQMSFRTRWRDDSLSRTEDHTLLLDRVPDPDAKTYNENLRVGMPSRIAGPWAFRAPSGEETVLLTVKPDGTFDWTAMAEGGFHGWYQLRYPGDRRFWFAQPLCRCQVVSSEYRRTSSRIHIEMLQVSDGKNLGDFRLEVTLEVSGTMDLHVQSSPGLGDKPTRADNHIRLHRAVPGTRYSEYLVENPLILGP